MLGCLVGDGASSDVPMWQFCLDVPIDGYQPGWHNYLPNPQNGEDSSKIVEQLHWEHLCYQDARTRATEGVASSGAVLEPSRESLPPLSRRLPEVTRPAPLEAPQSVDTSRTVQSGGHRYKLDFHTGKVDTPMTQTNSKTGKMRPIRFVKTIDQCSCSKCVRPAPPQPSAQVQSVAAEQSREEEPLIPIELPGCAELTTMVQSAGPPRNHPAFWRGLSSAPEASGSPMENLLVNLPLDSVEAKLVRDQFIFNYGAPKTWSDKMLEVKAVQRIENQQVYQRYWEQGVGDGLHKTESVMFHGCKNEANQNSIIANGFQTKCGKSPISGANAKDGSWFAHISSYSDGSYVYVDRSTGWRHIFVCMVLGFQPLKDNATMKVVRQDRAYPQWLLTYKLKQRT